MPKSSIKHHICTNLEPKLEIPKKELEGFFVFLREYYNLSLPLDEKERQINKLVEYMMRNSQKQLHVPLSLQIETEAIYIKIGDPQDGGRMMVLTRK